MGKGQLRSVNREKVNYSELLNELQREQNTRLSNVEKKQAFKNNRDYNSRSSYKNNGSNSQDDYRYYENRRSGYQKKNFSQNNETEENQEITVLSKTRQKIMSNENIKYLYDGRTNTIHDKNCRHVRQIPDSELCYSEYYIPEMRQCKECSMRAYIHAGAKDYNNYGVYHQLFERMNADVNMLRHIYIECGMKTEAFFNVITIWNNEDTWKIEIIDKKGMVRLLHNNYHIDKTGKRCFDQGFHVQSDFLSNTKLEQAIDAIATYSFDMHNRFASEQRQRMSYYNSQTHKPEFTEKQDYIRLNDKPVEGAKTTDSNKYVDSKEHVTLLQQIKIKFKSFFAKNSNDKKENESDNNISIKIEDFKLISEVGLPRDGDRCIYIWRTKDKEIRWQVGIYDRVQHSFFITFGESTYVTDKSKVIAWKRITTGEGIYGIEDNQ